MRRYRRIRTGPQSHLARGIRPDLSLRLDFFLCATVAGRSSGQQGQGRETARKQADCRHERARSARYVKPLECWEQTGHGHRFEVSALTLR